MMKLCDYYESEYPTHDRTSCSDEFPINADVTGNGCRRCNAILFTEHEALKNEIENLKDIISMYTRV
jgi:hypothetical protein